MGFNNSLLQRKPSFDVKYPLSGFTKDKLELKKEKTGLFLILLHMHCKSVSFMGLNKPIK